MRVYGSTAIRNVAFVGHGGSGKTTLVDALAFVAGASRAPRPIKEGTTLTDYSPDEIERQHSISLGLAYAEWMDTKINLIDTPGYLDFFGEAVTGLYRRRRRGRRAERRQRRRGRHREGLGGRATSGTCRACSSSVQMDKEHADFERVFTDVKAHLSPKVVPVEIPIGEGPQFQGIINLFSGKAHIYKRGTKTGEYDEVDDPRGVPGPGVESYDEDLIETVASTDDALIERYLGGEEIPRDEVITALQEGAGVAGDRARSSCGSAAAHLRHARAARRKMVELLPSPAEVPPAGGRATAASARVFKTISEPHVGDVTLFRLYAGSLKNGAEVWNAEHEVAEKLNHLSVQQGQGAHRGGGAPRGRHRLGGQAPRHPHQRHLLPPRRAASCCRRSRSPRRWRPPRWWSSSGARRTSWPPGSTSCTRRTRPSTSSTTPSCGRR